MILWIFLSASQAGSGHRDPVLPQHDITITGERRRASLAQTASSVVVFDERALEAGGADRFDQILGQIPNLQFGSGEEGVAIRGQDSTGVLRNVSAFLGGARPRATLQVDGRAVSYYEYVNGSAPMWDVAKVEVFRSPQTTTQGRNSVAGALFVETKDPSFAWERRGRLVAGSFRTRQVSALLSGPLHGGQLAFRASGDLRLSRMSSDMVDAIAGADIDHDDYGIGRLKLLFVPDALPGMRVETTYVHNRSQAPQFEGVMAPFAQRRMTVPERTNGIMRINSDSLTTRATWADKDGWSANLTVSFGDAKLRRFSQPGLGLARVRVQDRSAEGIVRWEPEGPVELLAGASLLVGRQRQFIDITGLRIGVGGFRDRQSSLGLFGEARWRPLPALTLTAGLRRQSDRQERRGQVGTGPSGLGIDYDERFTAWLPKLSLAFQLSEGVTAGLLLQRAYHPGGVSFDLRNRREDRFDSERVRNAEAFVRARFAGGRGRVLVNLFHNDIEDAQRQRVLPLALPSGESIFVTDFVNAPSAWSRGMEAEIGWRAGERLAVSAGVGLLATRTRRTLTPGDPSRGKAFQRAPSLTASASIDWRPHPALRLSSQLRHHSAYFSDDRNSPERRIGAATIVDGRATLTEGRTSLFGYARNLFDQLQLTYLFSPTFGTVSDPREVGIGIERSF